jgi:hypothetical protein
MALLIVKLDKHIGNAKAWRDTFGEIASRSAVPPASSATAPQHRILVVSFAGTLILVKSLIARQRHPPPQSRGP